MSLSAFFALHLCAVPGEQCAIAMQTGLPMTALSVLGAQWRLKAEDRAALTTQYLPWAFHAGSRCPDLMTLYYEKHFHASTATHHVATLIHAAPLRLRKPQFGIHWALAKTNYDGVTGGSGGTS